MKSRLVLLALVACKARGPAAPSPAYVPDPEPLPAEEPVAASCCNAIIVNQTEHSQMLYLDGLYQRGINSRDYHPDNYVELQIPEGVPVTLEVEGSDGSRWTKQVTMIEDGYLRWTIVEGGAGLERACLDADMQACNDLADLDAAWGDPRAAAWLYAVACVGGVPIACGNLGNAHYNGEGVAQDAVEAARLFQLACDGGIPAGCNNLGVLYERGEGVEADPDKAAALFQQACAGGHASACE